MSFEVEVDVLNPGQFFGCCGLFELAARMTGDATARFHERRFVVETPCSLGEVLERLTSTPLLQIDKDNDTSSAIAMEAPFHLLLDWWLDTRAGGKDLKVWAGSMQGLRIARAMLAPLRDPVFHDASLFDVGRVVHDPADLSKKVEPFYFDARRAPNAHSRDVGFSANDLELTTTAFPAVELLCLVGLQRFRPSPSRDRRERRVFQYRTWSTRLRPNVAAAVVGGAAELRGTRAYRFENWFRSGQKKQKAFRPATLVDICTAQGD